jgi:hypothetical protein
MTTFWIAFYESYLSRKEPFQLPSFYVPDSFLGAGRVTERGVGGGGRGVGGGGWGVGGGGKGVL